MIVLDASALVDAVLDSLLRGGFSSRSPARTSAPLRTSRRRCSPHCPGSSARARSSPASARDALDEATALPQRLVLPTAAHLRRAYALRERMRILDGLCVALADELGCTLVTTDRRLAAAVAPCDVRTPQS